MALRATGAGKAEKRLDPPSLMLFNFDVDGERLKDEHKAFLRTEALPALLAGGSVRVVGLTDRTGSAAHNKTLSDKRVASTVAFLREVVPNLNLRQTSGFGEDAAAQEGRQDGTADERFRTVLLFLTAVPIVTRRKQFEISAKSFIAPVGSRIGVMPGFTFVPVPLPVPGSPLPPIAPLPVPRQRLLNLLAKATDAQYSENPVSTIKDKVYRLFSRVRFKVVFENGKILAAVPEMDTDVGKEGPIQPPPMIVSPVTVSPRGGPIVKFSWIGKGKPDPLVEPTFQVIRPRSSVFIWHIVEGTIDVSSGAPVVTAKIRGSQFPSHRLFVDSRLQPGELRQGLLAQLWDADLTDRTKVR